MSNRDKALSTMARFMGVPYVYGGPTLLPDALTGTDCRGAVIASWEDADPCCMGGSTYTGNMLECMLSTGKWAEVQARSELRPGDVVLTAKRPGVVGHTAMVGASGELLEEWPPEGRLVDWYEYPWEHYLHYVGEPDAAPAAPSGAYTVVSGPLNVRDAPSTSAAVAASYDEGETVYLDEAGIYAEGIIWGRYTGRESGEARYVAICRVEPVETFLARA